MAIYPTAIATDADLHIQANDLEAKTTIDGAHTSAVTTITVLSTTGFSASGVFTVIKSDGTKERIKYTGKTATTFTGCTRGYDGSTAMALAGAETISGRIVAAHHNVLKDEIIAIQTALGANPQNITTATNFSVNSLGIGVAASGTAGRLDIGGIAKAARVDIGGDGAADRILTITGSLSGGVRALLVDATTLSPGANSNAATLQITTTNSISKAGTGTHNILASAWIDNISIGAGASTVTNTVTLYIPAATQGGATALSLWVDSGKSRFDGFVELNDTVTHSGVQGALTDIGTSNAPVGTDAFGWSTSRTIVEAGSGTHNLLAGLRVAVNFANGLATTVDAVQIDIGSFGAPTGTTTATGLRVAAPTGATTNRAQSWLTSAGIVAGQVILTATSTLLHVTSQDFGNNANGPQLEIGRNSSAGLEGPAAGTLHLRQAGNTDAHIWSDNSVAPGILRIHINPPTGSAGTPSVSDTAGTVVGSQTSWHELKENFAPSTIEDYRMALQTILDTPLEWFSLKADGRRRLGYVIYEKDRGAWFSYNDGRQQVPALDERNLFGYHAASIKAIAHRLDVLEARINQLGARWET